MESWWSTYLGTVVLVFLAELGDKTQLAVVGLSSSKDRPYAVLFGSVTALVLSTVLAFAVGTLLRRWLDPRWIRTGAAVLFIVLGVVMLLTGSSKGGA